MEPDQGANMFGGPQGRGPRGPGGPGGSRGRQFGPGMFLGPTFFRAGDADKDQKLSAAEFQNLAATWYGVWDKDNSGKLNV